MLPRQEQGWQNQPTVIILRNQATISMPLSLARGTSNDFLLKNWLLGANRHRSIVRSIRPPSLSWQIPVAPRHWRRLIHSRPLPHSYFVHLVPHEASCQEERRTIMNGKVFYSKKNTINNSSSSWLYSSYIFSPISLYRYIVISLLIAAHGLRSYGSFRSPRPYYITRTGTGWRQDIFFVSTGCFVVGFWSSVTFLFVWWGRLRRCHFKVSHCCPLWKAKKRKTETRCTLSVKRRRCNLGCDGHMCPGRALSTRSSSKLWCALSTPWCFVVDYLHCTARLL